MNNKLKLLTTKFNKLSEEYDTMKDSSEKKSLLKKILALKNQILKLDSVLKSSKPVKKLSNSDKKLANEKKMRAALNKLSQTSTAKTPGKIVRRSRQNESGATETQAL
jgi:hypothetical protein